VAPLKRIVIFKGNKMKLNDLKDFEAKNINTDGVAKTHYAAQVPEGTGR
jgi:hypothetical protein